MSLQKAAWELLLASDITFKKANPMEVGVYTLSEIKFIRNKVFAKKLTGFAPPPQSSVRTRTKWEIQN